MPKNIAISAIDHEDRKSAPLTTAERAAIKRAEADVKAGRLHDHADVAARLRKRAAAIVESARRSTKRR